MDLRIRIIEFEALAVVVFEFAVPLDERPNFIGIKFFDAQDVILEMRSKVKGGGVIRTILIDDEDTIFIPELTEVDTMLVIGNAVRRGWNDLSA